MPGRMSVTQANNKKTMQTGFMETKSTIQNGSEFSHQSPSVPETTPTVSSMTESFSRAAEYLRSLAEDPDENCFVLSSN